jgi:L-glutamine-phosphate cytidylyltransferase
MQAVILAAGTGSRLTEVSHGLPKCLLPIGEQTLIEHQLEALSDAGIGQVLIVVGYKSDEVRKVVGNRATYIDNDRYAQTNSLFSLSLASEWVQGPFVLMNSDVLFHPDILHRLLSKKGNALAYDSTSIAGHEQTKVALREEKVIDLGKDLPAEIARGESLGLLCFDTEGSKALFARVKALIQNGGEKSWVMEAVRNTCSSISIRGVNVAGLPWAEIDFAYDLNRAQKEVWPAISKSRWKKTIHWRRVKWIATGLAALILIGIGWLIHLNIISADPTWSTVLPSRGNEFILTLPDGAQRWWIVSCEDTIQAMVYGPSTVRVEVRLVHFSKIQDAEQFVVEVAVNGKPWIWEVFKSTPDDETSASGLTIGDRDRIEFELPPGNHNIAVSLLAGNCDQFLARIRNPETDTDEEDDEQ